MQPQDVYNRGYDATITALNRWIATLSDVAAIECEQTAGYWRVRICPFERNACAAELMVSRQQTFDLEVANEGMLGEQVADFSLFQPLLEAIARGNAVCRTWSAMATGSDLMREVIVKMADGREWSMSRIVTAGTAATELSAVANDRVFVAYRRA